MFIDNYFKDRQLFFSTKFLDLNSMLNVSEIIVNDRNKNKRKGIRMHTQTSFLTFIK